MFDVKWINSSPVFPEMDGPLWILKKCFKFTWV